MNTQELEIKQIFPSNTNPRKQFDEKSINELAENIKQVGLIQAILVRPKKVKGKGHYEIVCGERRYRASKIAGFETIPATIRELDDETAFEFQIIENLERKDVHPIDEAESFQKLIDSGKYTIEDISLKFAKTQSFVAQRLKLADLIDDIKTDFYNGELNISQAILIAKLDKETQEEIKDNAEYYGYASAKELKSKIERHTIDLDNACFDVTDVELYKKAGSCLNCPKRSGANPSLFEDIENSNACFDKFCFQNKTSIYVENKVNELINEPNMFFIQGYCADIPINVTKILEENEIISLRQYNDFRIDKDGKKAFWVSGTDAGKFENIELYKINNTDNSQKLNSMEYEIEKFKSRAERNLELDREKIYKRVIAEIVEVDNDMINSEELKKSEMIALACDLLSYRDDEWLQEEFSLEDIPYGIKKYELVEKIISKEFLNKLIRKHLQRTFISTSNLDYGKAHEPAAIFYIARDYHGDKVDLVIQEQNEKAEKRIFKENQRIAELEGIENNNSNS